MKRTLRFLGGFLICLLGMATMGRAAGGGSGISGPDTVCAGSYGNYAVASPQAHIIYVWSVTPLGVITTPGTPGSTATILWGLAGTATITILQEVDSTLATWGPPLTQVVVIEPLPTPLIASNVNVGCQTLDDSVAQFAGGKTHSQHIIDDSGGCVKVCQGSVVTYTASGMPGDHFGWSIAGGTILAQGADTCQVLWGAPGPGSVTVYDTSAYGCVGSKSVCIDIIARPHAHFYAMPDSTSDTVYLCLDNTVMFIDNSTASSGSPIVSWFWMFGDGTYFSALGAGPVSHEYVTAGVDTATLVVRNACGCTDTFRMIVIVNPSTGVTITCPGVVCQNAIDTYYLNPVPPCGSWLWTVDGGTVLANHDSSIVVQWNSVDTTGFGYVIFDATPCAIACPGLTVIRIPVIQTLGHISGPLVVCDNSQYIYSLPQWPTTVFNWTISGTTAAFLTHDDQNNQIVLNTSGPGVVYLQCNYFNTLLGCGGVAYDTITVLPSDSLTGPLEACLNTQAGPYQVGPGAGLNTNWTITDPTGYSYPVVTTPSFTTPLLTIVGVYTITVTPGPGATYCPIAPYLVKVLPLPPPPDSITGPDTACFGIPAIYTAHAPVAGDIFEWAAITGSCNAAEGNTSSITFTGGGAFGTVELWRVTASAPHCHSDTITKVVYRPQVNLSISGADTVCPSQAYTYTASYGSGETYDWSVYTSLLGSVQVNGLSSASILWNNFPGAAPLVILKMRKCDSTYIDTFQVHIRNNPALSIIDTPNPVCLHEPMNVTLLPMSITGGIVWTWGDGTANGSGDFASHTYTSLIASSTTFTVTATVYNPYGCADTISVSTVVTVLPAPVVAISPAGPFSFCPPTPILAPLSAVIASGFEPTSKLRWCLAGFGPVDSCTGPPFTACDPYTATGIGSYFVVAEGANGCVDTSNVVLVDTTCSHSSMPCTMNPTPWALIDTATVSCGVVHLHGRYSTAPGLTALGETWTWPTGALGVVTTSTTLNCYFAVAGYYDFQYNVRFADTLGDTCTLTYDTSVLVPFIAGTLHTIACTGGAYHVTMLDHSNYYPGHWPSSYSWYVNSSFVGHTTTPTFVWPLPPGAYNLCEWAYYAPDSTTDSCMACDSVYLPAYPVAHFTFGPDTTCAVDAAVIFTNTSSPTGLSYLWNFGDSSTNTEADPYRVYKYPTSGTGYNVILSVSNIYGCTASDTQFVPLHKQDLDGNLSGGGIFCAGSPVLLTYTPDPLTDYPQEYYWMANLDTMYTSTIDSTYVYSSGSYWVTGTNHYGCYVNTQAAVVSIIQVPPAVITGDHNACINVPYTLNGWVGDDPNVSYKWYKNHVPDGTGSTVTDPAAYVTGVPDTFMLVVSIAMGTDTCSDTSALFLFTVNPLPAPPSIIPAILSCASYSFNLMATGPSWGSYLWSNGLSGQNITVIGGGPYGVWYTDTFGCTSFGSTFVEKDPRAYLWIFPTGCYEWCSTQLPTPYIVGPITPFEFWKYQHAPVGPGVDSGYYSVPGPWYPPSSGFYDLILQNMYCSDTSGIMDITIDSNCACTCFRYSATAWTTACNPPREGCCQWKVSLCITNSCYSVKASISSASGTFTPSSFGIPAGSSCDTFTFAPTGSFSGGWLYFTITWTDDEGHKYNCPDSVYMPPCSTGSNCSCFRFSTAGWRIACPPPAPPSCCQWKVALCISNSCETVKASISSTSGTFSPSSFAIPAGYSCDTFTFMPVGSFSGGWLYFTITWTDGQGNKYNCPDSVYLTPCVGSRDGIQPAADEALLALVPNPAQNSTRIDYGLDGTATTGAIEIFDMTGRLMGSYAISSHQGSWQLQLDGYAAGVYMVALRENGVVVRQGKLSVIR